MLCAFLRVKGTGALRAVNLNVTTPNTASSPTDVKPHPLLRSLTPTTLLVSLIALLTLSFAAATPALAGSSHTYSHTLGSGRGEGAGELELTPPVLFEEKREFRGDTPQFNVAGSGVAVNDETHDVYVADTGNRRVDEFTSERTFVRAFGKDVGAAPGEDTCTAIPGCKAGAVGSEPGALEAPNFVAVDNDLSSPSHGDVYVGVGVGKEARDGNQYIEFPGATSGTYTLTFEGETTKPIAFVTIATGQGNGADAVAAQEALEELPKIGKGKGNLKANESPALGYIRIEFVGALGDTTVPSLSCDESRLAPAGSKCSVEVASTGSKHVGEIISKFSSAGVLEASWGTGGQMDGSTAPQGPFAGQLNGIAVDTAGDLWVYDGSGLGEVYEFGQEGDFKENFRRDSGSACGVAAEGPGELYYCGQREVGDSFESASGIALDTAGKEVYEDSGSSIESPGQTLTSPELERGGGAGLGVDSSVGTSTSSGTVYAANAVSDLIEAFGIALGVNPTGPGSASGTSATETTLNGVVNPEGLPVTECYFEYGESSEYGQSVKCEEPDAEAIGKGLDPVPVHAKLTGLHGGITYHYRLVARNANGTVEATDETFTTLTVPVVTGAEAANVTEGAAELRADVNPDGLQVSRCTFEYGTGQGTYGTSVPCEQRKVAIGFGTVPVPVSVKITGLTADSTYHWRLSVKDVNGEAFEPGHTFVYPTTTGAELPDNRTYELVTPPFKNGSSVGGITFGTNYSDFAEDGSRVMAEGIQCFADSQSCTGYRSTVGEPFEFTRGTSGWVTSALSPPSTEFSENSPFMVGAEEGVALFSAPTGPGDEDEWYARSPQAAFSDLGPAVPPGSTAGTDPFEDGFHAATADLSHLVFEVDNAPGSSGFFWPFDHTALTHGSESLYEYVAGRGGPPLLVGVNGGYENGENHNLVSDCGTVLGTGGINIGQGRWNALSADGRMVYFTVCGSELYARVDGETAEAHTVKIATPECGEGALPAEEECRNAPTGEATFQGASQDGSEAFFVDTQKLTDGASKGTGSTGECDDSGVGDCNLYESLCTKDCEEAGEARELVDVSAVPAGETHGPRVQAVLGSSADGSHVYFVADGTLTAAPNAEGQKAAPGDCRNRREGTCNVYVYERDQRYPGGHLAFVSAISGAELSVDSEVPVVNVTPNGRFLVFEHSGQVYRYDAASEQLARVSIGEDGYNDNGDGGAGAASIVPAVETLSNVAGPPRGDPTMSNDGARVFFDSPIALTPHALNDVVIGYAIEEYPRGSGKSAENPNSPVYAQNVYEWEQEGHGSCPAGQSSGCTYLISDGHDTSVSTTKCTNRLNGNPTGSGTCLFGVDATGDNVFFQTTDRLVPADTDTQEDIYDARVCEPEKGNPCITEPPPAPAPCDGENCHGIPEATPSLIAPGSASFNGEGNAAPSLVPKPKPKTAALPRAEKLAKALHSCKKIKVRRKRQVCEKQARAKYGSKVRAKKTNQRAGR